MKESETLPQPRVIPRSEHTVSRSGIDREALKVLYRLRDEGHTAYLVGGGVRDLLLGKQPKDFDISTSAKPGELRKIFRNSRIIGRRFRLVQVFFPGGKIIEVSTFRCRSEFELDGSEVETLAQDNTFGNPPEDAFRRDLTINALFYEIETFTVIDYTGGVEDLRNQLVRVVGDAERRLLRDPVRMLRAIRHAARAGFAIEGQTWAAIRRHVDKLALCPDSRLRDELFKDLRAGASRRWAELALASGIFFELFPFYRGIMPTCDEAAGSHQELAAPTPPAQLLFKLLTVVDSLTTGTGEISEELLLSMLLLPWAQARFGLPERQLSRAEAYKFSRQLRAELDEILAPLNIKRSNKEGMAVLLSNLPLLVHNCPAKGEQWPRWLSRKGYFERCRAFYELYLAALAEQPPPAAITKAMAPPPAAKKRDRPASRPRPRGGRSPAHAKGGIFGLKK
ncbi:MAG: poly(A) polymerase [Desulfurivibrio sp.]|nr:poly(A) polymerase [Desulfurivibrio sp.]